MEALEPASFKVPSECTDLWRLKRSLLFITCIELREICVRLKLSDKGKKGYLIEKIIHFLQTGEKINLIKLPAVSCAAPGADCQITPSHLILKGAYKNDLRTRNFFKSVIGDHFHFTAFGIDWINERWLAGNPPTYQEYADIWQAEVQRTQEFSCCTKRRMGIH